MKFVSSENGVRGSVSDPVTVLVDTVSLNIMELH